MTKINTAFKYDHIIYYCTFHNTTIYSKTYNITGRKKIIRKCNDRIYSDKNSQNYYIDTDYSNYCNKIINKEYVNLADITEEVDNYKSFREHLIN